MTHARPIPSESVQIFHAATFHCIDGPNTGETLSFAAELLLDDIYAFPVGTMTARLSLTPSLSCQFTIGPDTDVGTPTAPLHLDSALTFMSPDGQMHEALVLVETADGAVADIYLLPLTTFAPKTEYRLVGINTVTARQKFAQRACVSFTGGTHITMASGEQRLIETLRPGDRVLTRDDGVQPLRWIGHSTMRAIGEFAPICIRAGTLNNARDLIVSPEHRLFIYQRADKVGAGRSELLIKARHLVNGDSVTWQAGGFVDYFQLLFDAHQIIYAEGIAAESMLIDTRTRSVLPGELSDNMGTVVVGHSDVPLAGLDVNAAILDRDDATEVLRKASAG